MNKIYIRGNEIATKEYVDSLSIGGGTEGSVSCVVNKISASEGATVINYDKDIRPNMQGGEIKYFYLNDALIISEEEDEVIFSAGEIIKVSTNISGGDASTTDSICSDNNAYEVSFVTFGDGTKSYSVNKMEYLEKWELEYADIDWDQIINKPFGEVIPQDEVYVLDYDTRTFKREVVIEGEVYYYKYELTEEEQATFHSIGTAEGILRLYANGEEIDVPVTFTDGQISNAINSTISFETSDDTYLLYKDGSVITSNSTEEADLELVFIPKTKYTPIPEEFLSENIATKKYVDDVTATSQPLLTPGENITIDENNVISAEGETLPRIIYTNLSINTSPPNNTITNEETILSIEEEINKRLNTNILPKIELYHAYDNREPAELGYYLFVSNKRVRNTVTSFQFRGEFNISRWTETNGGRNFYLYYVEVKGTWDENDYFTVTKVTINYTSTGPLAQMSDVIGKRNTSSFTPTEDYHPATKKYVDDKFSEIELKEPITIRLVETTDIYHMANSDVLIIQEYMNKCLQNNLFHPNIILIVNNNSQFYQCSSGFGRYSGQIYFYGESQSSNGARLTYYTRVINFNSNYDETTDTINLSFGSYTQKTFIPMYSNNVTEFTPTGDYNPATKKYVDDIVGNINSILDTINGEEV